MIINDRLKAFISTTKPDVSRAFYEKKLGLRLLSEDSFGIEFDVNGAHLRLTFVEKLTPQPFTVLGWDTKDIKSAIRSLRKQGITFERYDFIEQDEDGIWIAPGGTQVAWFRDPDGNLLSLSE